MAMTAESKWATDFKQMWNDVFYCFSTSLFCFNMELCLFVAVSHTCRLTQGQADSLIPTLIYIHA